MVSLENGELLLLEDVFDSRLANAWFERIKCTTDWQQPEIRVAGRMVRIPRRQAWYGDCSARYSYSGLAMIPHPWTDTLLEIRSRIEEICEARFNSVLLNHYRDGQDSMGWHSDDEPELGVNPCIASLSLGASRVFRLQHKKEKARKIKLDLSNGSLLVMRGALQHHWRHQVPKTQRVVADRINLTFRYIHIEC